MKKKGDKEKDSKKVDFNDLINKNLQDFKLVFDYSGYQYTKLDLNNKNLDVLSTIFKEFKYLESINLSNNLIIDITHLSALPNLVSLNIQRNNVKDMKALNVQQGWKSLRILNLNYNKLAQLVPVAIPNLAELKTFGGHPKLKKIQLRRNKITTLQGLSNLPQLNFIYLGQNKIKSLVGLEAPNIKILHLRKNIISVFDETFPAFQNLVYLNLRQNLIEKLQEINKTKDLPNLKEIIFSENPLIAKYQFYLFDVINTNLKLRRINKVSISKSIKLRAFKHVQEKWKKSQEQKKRLEQEERLKLQQQQQKPQDG